MNMKVQILHKTHKTLMKLKLTYRARRLEARVHGRRWFAVHHVGSRVPCSCDRDVSVRVHGPAKPRPVLGVGLEGLRWLAGKPHVDVAESLLTMAGLAVRALRHARRKIHGLAETPTVAIGTVEVGGRLSFRGVRRVHLGLGMAVVLEQK